MLIVQNPIQRAPAGIQFSGDEPAGQEKAAKPQRRWRLPSIRRRNQAAEATATAAGSPAGADSLEVSKPAGKMRRLAGVLGRGTMLVTSYSIRQGKRLVNLAIRLPNNQFVQWATIAGTTGVLLPGRPKDVIPVVFNVNARLLGSMLPEPVVAALFGLNRPKVDAHEELKQTRLAATLAVAGQAVAQNRVAKPAIDYVAQNRWAQILGRKAGEFYRWMLRHPSNKVLDRIFEPLARKTAASHLYKEAHPGPGEAVIEGKYSKLTMAPGQRKRFQRLRDAIAVLRGKEIPARGPDTGRIMTVDVQLPTGTVSRSKLQAELGKDVQGALQKGLAEERQLGIEHRQGARQAKRSKWLTRILGVPALALAFNLGWAETLRVAWTEWEGTYETLGTIRDTYQIPGFGPTGVPHLHPTAYIVAPKAPSTCIVEVVDAWSKARWWCVLPGATNNAALKRLPNLPIVGQVELLDKPLAGGFPDGGVMPSVQPRQLLKLHPENEWWEWFVRPIKSFTDPTLKNADPRNSDPYDFWIQPLVEGTTVNQLPIARIQLKMPNEIQNPGLRKFMEALYTKDKNNWPVLTPTGMAIISAIAGLSLDEVQDDSK